MPEICPHAQEIGAIKATQKKHDIALNGNGKDGLTLKVDRLEHSVHTIEENLDTIARSTSAFAKSQIEQDVIEKQKVRVSDKKARALQTVGTSVAVVAGILGALKIVLNFIG